MPQTIFIYGDEGHLQDSFIVNPGRPTLFERLGWAVVWLVYAWLAWQLVVIYYRAYIAR